MFQQQAESERCFNKNNNHTMFQQQPNHNNNMPNSISEEPINRLPSNSGGSANQSQLFYSPSSSPEEPINRLPSNPGGTAHQSDQSYESENEYNEFFWSADVLNYYRPLFKAAQSGDWETAQSFIYGDPDALTAEISIHLGTVLHIAADFCQWKFILMLLELDVWTPQSIAVQNVTGNTVLHYVAQAGSLKIAKALVEKNANLLQTVDDQGDLPLVYSIFGESKEMVRYLSLITRVDSPTYPFFIPSLPMILRNLIQSGYHDIALYFVQRFTHLVLAKDEYGNSLLRWLTCNPSCFFSGSNLGFLERQIYKFVRVEIQSAYSLALQSITTQGTMLGWFKRLLWKAITQLAPSIKIVRDAKMTHECAIELVNHVVKELSKMSYSQIYHFLQTPEPILSIAVEGGIEEIVRTLLRHFSDWMYLDVVHQIFHVAIEYRQEKIVNILREISSITMAALCSGRIKSAHTNLSFVESDNTALRLAAKLAPDFKLFSVSGPAVQMQRELQWFKEVEMYTHPAYRVLRNSEKQTAKDAFRIAHKKLSEDAEKWMKDTANSCMLVSTLIATVLFAAAFTVPGGNFNDKGIPIFLRTKIFTVFAISNALGLFSSLTSLLMFLAIITARYAIEDFLESLPKKLIIGLGSLFFSIVAMIIAFGAALTIVLSERWNWVFVPITLLASFPVAIFVMLQLPLFVQMVQSTYGASMFRPWPTIKFE